MGGVCRDDGRRDDDRGYPGEREENLARSARYRAEAEQSLKRDEARKTDREREDEQQNKIWETNAWLRRTSG